MTATLDVPAIAQRARDFFATEKTRSVDFRLEQLRALEASIRQHEPIIFDALMADLHKAPHEAYPSELGLVYAELRVAQAELRHWLEPERRSMPLPFFPAGAYRMPEPLGTALIISPWNYPFQLALAPLVGCIAAGCNAVVKPSEVSAHTAKAVETVLAHAFGSQPGFVTVVTGEVSVSTQLLAEKWDTIFFTGSTQVGRIVMEAAAKHLTPVTLELGGKSPVLVDETADLDATARRIIWAKTYNTGQTCIAPDYVLVDEQVKEPLLRKMEAALTKMHGVDPQQSKGLGRIVSARHFQRLKTLMEGGTVRFGGKLDEADKYIAPTVLVDVKLDHPLMTEEIFGPLLPVLGVKSWKEAIAFVNARPKPLALYAFSNDADRCDEVLQRCSSGGAVLNDCVIQFAAHDLPFGGVGPSGMGSSHGYAGFCAFSHFKSVVTGTTAVERLDGKVRYPPYNLPMSVMRQLVR